MHTRHEAHVLLDDLANPHILGGGDRFLHVRACAEQEHSKFPRSQSLANVLSLDLLILGEAGEVEKTDVQPLLIESIHSHRHVKGIGSDACRTLSSSEALACRQVRSRRTPCPSVRR